MGVVDVYVRVFCVCPVSELTGITICDYGEVVLPHGLDNCVRMVILQKPWVKSVPEMSTPLSTPSVLPTVKPAPSITMLFFSTIICPEMSSLRV